MDPTELSTATENQARSLLVQYLVGDEDLEKLYAYFGPLSWLLAETPDVPFGLRALVGEVQLALDEYSGGYSTDADLHQLLRQSLGTQRMRVGPRAPQVDTESQSRTTFTNLKVPALA
jgi:hypothetical protein